jgi:hypothetical protein
MHACTFVHCLCCIIGERSQLLQEEQAKHWQQTVKVALELLLLKQTLLLEKHTAAATASTDQTHMAGNLRVHT